MATSLANDVIVRNKGKKMIFQIGWKSYCGR